MGMPALTIRMSTEEIAAMDRAAARHNLSRYEFARRAITAAAEPDEKTSEEFPYGVWKGRTTYKEVMQLLRG
jgi:hypothetical protein